MKHELLILPGVRGMNTDFAPYLVGPNQSVLCEDAILYQGMLKERRGFTLRRNFGAQSPEHLVSCSERAFLLADSFAESVAVSDGSLVSAIDATNHTIFEPLGSVPAPVWLSRGFYRDEEIFCAQDGQHGMLLYSGAPFPFTSTPTGTATWQSGTARVVLGAGNLSGDPGSYLTFFFGDGAAPDWPTIAFRVLERPAAGSATLEGARLAGANLTISAGMYETAFGAAYPAIAVYEAGVGSHGGGLAGAFVGDGTKWATGDWGRVISNAESGARFMLGDALLTKPVDGTASQHVDVLGTVTDTGFICNMTAVTNQPYAITRRCPAKDVASHRGSLAMTGVGPHPNTVYVGPPGWNPRYPPGFVPPFNPRSAPTSSDPNDFLLFPIEVPTPYEGDPNVALLEAPEGLLVLKRKGIHIIHGDYPNFARNLIADGPGCIDIRSAQNLTLGRFWASTEGIMRHLDGEDIRDITVDKINREWRALMRDFEDSASEHYCTIGEARGALVVNVRADTTTQVTFTCDLRSEDWICRFTNHDARFFFTSKLSGQTDRLLWVGDAVPDRTVDSSLCFDGDPGGGPNLADYDPAEPSLRSPEFPRLVLHTSEGLAREGGIEGDALLGDVAVHANVLAPSPNVDRKVEVTLVHGGGVRQSTTSETKLLGTIEADTVDRVDRHELRANRSGRLHQLQIEHVRDPGAAGETFLSELELPEIALEFIGSPAGT